MSEVLAAVSAGVESAACVDVPVLTHVVHGGVVLAAGGAHQTDLAVCQGPVAIPSV